MHSLYTAIDCEQPATPIHGRVTVSSLTTGYVANYQCDDGYNLVGHRERTCITSTGQWTHSNPTCHREFIIIGGDGVLIDNSLSSL